jgi:predicted methyltransferase
MKLRYIASAGVALAFVAWARAAQSHAEIPALAKQLGWRPGSAVGDVGAGKGRFTIAAAELVGPEGVVYATEVDARALVRIKDEAWSKGLRNVITRPATATDSGLPAGCCESVLLRGVYHHLTAPENVNRSLFAALQPGGLLAVVDFAPKWFLSLFFPVRGVPDDRKGHGVEESSIVRELTGAGFELVGRDGDWFHGHYCLLFRRP